MLNEGHKKVLTGLANRLAAEDHYDDHATYGKVPKGADLENREWQSAGSIIDGLDVGRSPYLMMMMKTVDNVSGDMSSGQFIEDQVLANTKYDSFSLVSRREGTFVLLAKSEDDVGILRISPHVDSKLFKLYPSRQADSLRLGFQGMLQTTDDNINIGSALQVEQLPFGAVIKLVGDERAVYSAFLEEVCENTCYSPSSTGEVIVMPDDSTLTMFDCGECEYTEDFLALPLAEQVAEEQRSQKFIQDRLESWDLPEQMIWTDINGDLKQRNAFLSADDNDGHAPELKAPGL